LLAGVGIVVGVPLPVIGECLIGVGLVTIVLSLAIPPLGEWEREWRRQRRESLPLFLDTLRAEFSIDFLTFEDAVRAASCPDVIDDAEPHSDADAALIALARRIYPPPEQGKPAALSDRSSLGRGPFFDFHHARGELKDYFDGCGDNVTEVGFGRFFQKHIGKTARFMKSLAYLELMLARSTGGRTRITGTKTGLWLLYEHMEAKYPHLFA
jgi:hypothetical protein